MSGWRPTAGPEHGLSELTGRGILGFRGLLRSIGVWVELDWESCNIFLTSSGWDLSGSGKPVHPRYVQNGQGSWDTPFWRSIWSGYDFTPPLKSGVLETTRGPNPMETTPWPCVMERRRRRVRLAVKPPFDFHGFPESAMRGAVLSGTRLCRVQSFRVSKDLELWAARGPEVPEASMRWLEEDHRWK